MTEPERAALDHIRQVVDSVLGVPNIPDTLPPDPNASIPDTLPQQLDASIPDALPSEITPPTPDPLPLENDASILPVPYLSQFEPGTDQFVSDSGAAAGAMLLQAYTGQTIPPAEFYKLTGQVDDAPLSFEQIINTLGAQGIPVELRSGLKLADLSLILFSGRPVIALVNQMVLQAAGLTQEKFDGPHYLAVVGLDVAQAFVHDPLRRDSTGQSQGIPWLVFYQAWTQAEGYERAILVPRLQLIRRVCVTANPLNVYSQPDAKAKPAGTVNKGDLFEIATQANGWGEIGEDRWINLKNTVDI